MRWIKCYVTLLTRRNYPALLSYLSVMFLLLIPGFLAGQSPNSQPNSDSINYYLNVIDQGEKQVGIALSRIGYLYMEVGKYNTALNYFDQAIPKLNGEQKSREAAEVYWSKGFIYEYFGDNAEPRRYYRLSERQYTLALENFQQIQDVANQLKTYKSMAGISAKRNNFASAFYYQNQVIEGLSQAYQDSLQQQADSFNDLLTKELQSSKDTISITQVSPQTLNNNRGVPLWNWRHFALLGLGIAAIIFWWGWSNSHKELQGLESSKLRDKTNQEQQQRKIAELQKINLALSRTEKEQRNLNQTKDKIFSIISHDLRSPINTIAGFLNILGAKLKSIGDIELKALAHEMEESTSRLSHFLDDLLKWSMSQMGKIEANPERVDVMELVDDNYQLVESRLKGKNIHFQTNIDENVLVYADTNMLNLVLRNLISNAIKFTRQGGYIAIGLTAKGEGHAELTVADDGIGISEEDQQKLFAFEGSSINGIPEHKGAGLGLMLCQEFVELNRGQISVESQVGKGTRFRIVLPSKPF